MGIWIQTIVDLDATADEAEPLGHAMLGWLVERDIVKPAAAEGATSRAAHTAGPRSPSIVAEPEIYLHNPRVHEFRVITERRVYFSGEPERISCPHCTEVTVFNFRNPEGSDAEWDRVSATFEAWCDRGVEEAYFCPVCRKHSGLNDLQWEPRWGFGCLAFEFWNWPMLAEEFVEEMSARLNHRTVLTRWKI